MAFYLNPTMCMFSEFCSIWLTGTMRLAKLHLHTDTTLALFSQVTESFGNCIRTFKEKTCKVYPTQELEREWAA